MKPTQRWCQTISLILIAIGCLHVIYFQPHRQLLVRLRPAPVQSDVTAGVHDVTAGARDVTAGARDVTPGAHDVTSGAHDVTADVTSRNVSVTSRPRLVVIVSNPRSGSSFLGELLSSPADAMYLYEPLRYLQLIGHNVGKTAHLSPNPAQRNFVQEELLRLLNCQFEHDEMFNKSLKYMIWNKPELGEHVTPEQRRAVCLDLNYRVIKVIRPSLAAVLPLLELPEYDIHVVHLVRDPRAIVNSLRVMESWYKTLPPEKICQAYTEDLNGSKDIDSKRLIRVRYEDLVSDITKEARRLFKFIGQPMTSDVEFFIRRHTQTPKDPPPSSLPDSVSQLFARMKATVASLLNRTSAERDTHRPESETELRSSTTRRRHRRTPKKAQWRNGVDFNGYYGTYRFADFDELHWLKELPREDRNRTEEACAEVMERLGYPLLYPGEEEERGEGDEEPRKAR